MKLAFCETVGNYNPGGFWRVQQMTAPQQAAGEVPVQQLSDRITFISPAGGQFQSDSGELANGLFRERFDNA